MRRSLAKFSESEASNHTPSLADFTTTTPELKFSVHTGPHASIPGEGCAGFARRRAGWTNSLPPNSRRATPPIYPDLIYDRHRLSLSQVNMRGRSEKSLSARSRLRRPHKITRIN